MQSDPDPFKQRSVMQTGGATTTREVERETGNRKVGVAN